MTKTQFYKKWNKLIDFENIDNIKISLKCKPKTTAKCNGTSIWSNSKNIVCRITEIELEFSGDCYIYAWVYHNKHWEIYTDERFEKDISKIVKNLTGIKVDIGFTEQGMQNNGIASMECASWDLANYVLEHDVKFIRKLKLKKLLQ